MIVALASVGAVLSLVIIVALLSGRPNTNASNEVNATNVASNIVSNDADNATNNPFALDTNATNQTADADTVFDPSGPNPIAANNPGALLLDASTMNANGDAAKKDGNLATAAEWWSLSAAKGDAEGQAELGIALALGNGVEMDDDGAFALFQKSADQGNVDGEHWEAAYYANGYGSTPLDPAKARYWYQKAAAQGDTNAEDWLSKNPG